MLVLLFALGACIGSFLCCQARRLHLRASHRKTLGSRSVCLNCGQQLKWYDNLPIVSWAMLRGRCRKCRQRIGVAELLSELGVALAFLCIGTTFDVALANILDWCGFVLLLGFIIVMCFLAIYDGLYGELPVLFLIIAVLMSATIMILRDISVASLVGFSFDLIYRPLLSVLILGGLYLVLYLMSKGKWVGDGDWILGVAIGLVLFDPWLALIELFLANTIACFVMLPFVLKKRKAKIYFGPFLVIALVLVLTFSTFIYAIIG